MAARAKITLDVEEYIKGLNTVKAETTKSASGMSKEFNKFGRDVSKAGKLVNTLSTEIGSGLGEAGKIFSSLSAGPVAALTASIGALAVSATQTYDQLTVSADEYAAKLSATTAIEERRLSEMRKANEEEAGYIERLKDLSTKEGLSNAEKEEAVFLINTLKNGYKDLSVSIDDVTGRIEGLNEAELKLNDTHKKQIESQLENVIQNKTEQSEAAVRGHLTPQGWKKYVGYVTGDTQDAQTSSEYYNSMSIQGKKDLAREMLDTATTKEDIAFWTEEQNRLAEIESLQERLNNLRKDGTETTKEHAAELKKASEEERKELDTELQAYERFNAERQKAEEEAELRAEAAAQRDLERLKREEYARASMKQRIRSEALRATGRGKQAAAEEALLEAEQRKGEPLTDEERKNAIELSNSRYELASMKNAATTMPESLAPRVNSLIARGGSSAPVKMPKVEEYQAKQLNVQENLSKTAQRILDKIDNFGTI